MDKPRKLQELCEDYFRFGRGISTDNCLFLLTLADGAGLKVLFQKSLDFCLDHFTQLTDTDEFVHLNRCLLIHLLQSDRLNVPDEFFVLGAIHKWSVANRVDLQVMSTFRLSLIEDEELERFSDKQVIELARHIKRSSGRMKENPRTPDRRERLVVFTWSNGDVIRYDPITHAWARVAHAPFDVRASNFTVAILGDSLYLLSRKSVRYDLKHHTWHEDVAPTNVPRDDLDAVVLNGSLYTLGGHWYNSVLCMSTVERYDARNNTWHLCASMRQPRSGLVADVLDGRIYVAGGARWDSYGESLRLIECYRPHEDTWSYVSDPGSLGWDGEVRSLVSFEGCLYLLDLSSQVFKYQAKSDVWEKFTWGDFGYNRCLHVLNGKLYASDRDHFKVLVRVMGDTEFRWRELELPTPEEKRFLPDFSEYETARAIYFGLDCAD